MAKPKLQKFIKVAVREADGAILLNTGKASNPNTPCQQQVRAAFASANLGGQCKGMGFNARRACLKKAAASLRGVKCGKGKRRK